MQRSDGRRGLASLALLVGISAMLVLALNGHGMAVAALLAFLWLAWRFDNRTGSLTLLAVLFLIAIAVPALLLALMAVTH